MLSRNAKEIFRMVIKSNGYQIAYKELETQLGLDANSVQSACKQLIDMRLAEEKIAHYVRGSTSPWGIVLSERGRNYRKFKIKETIVFSVKSILVPILVTILTTILLRWIGF